MNVEWAPAALADLARIRRYIAEQAPGSAAVVVARIQETVLTLEQYPHRGRVGRVDGSRELGVPRTPYIIVYRVRGSSCEIANVVHGAQRWPPQDV